MHSTDLVVVVGLLLVHCLIAHAFNVRTYAVDDVGVLMLDLPSIEMNISHRHRQLVSSTACASPPYTSVCTSSNPDNCPCSALTDSEKQQILDAHNHRRDVAASGNEICATSSGSPTAKCPSATNMNSLFWDDGLARIATYWAHQCIWEHHNNVNSGEQSIMYSAQCADGGCLAIGYTDDSWIGENLAASGTSGNPDWSLDNALSGIERWFDESELYYFDAQQSFGVTGHWTQGAWASTRYVGCGYAACNSGSPFSENVDEWFNFVCKYYPGGNYNGVPPYETGAKCSQCSADRNGCFGEHDGLCGGGQCLRCAADFFQDTCMYNNTWCAADMLCEDGVGRPLICGNISSQQLIAGVVAGFFAALILIPVMVGVIIYSVVRLDGAVDTDSTSEPRKTGRNLLVLVGVALLLFLFASISFVFIKSDVLRSENYEPSDACKAGWFFEYVGYEFGKALVAIFVMYRVYTTLCGTQYEIPSSHLIWRGGRVILWFCLPFLALLYFILIMLAFFLPEPQFGVLITQDYTHQYCGFDRPSAVFVFGHCLSFMRELTLNGFAAYLLFDRYRAMYQNGNSATAKKTSKPGPDVELEEATKKKTNDKTGSGSDRKNTTKSEVGLEKEAKRDADVKKPAAGSKGGKNKNNKQLSSTKNTNKQDKSSIKASIKKGKSVDTTSDANKAEKKKPAPKKAAVAKAKSGKTFSTAELRSTIRRYLICALIMFVSSFICQILLCIIRYPSFFISFDILVQCLCCFVILWISQKLWIKVREKRQNNTSSE